MTAGYRQGLEEPSIYLQKGQKFVYGKTKKGLI